MLIPLLICALALLLIGLAFWMRSTPWLDLCVVVTAGSCLGGELFQVHFGPLPITLARLGLAAVVARLAWQAIQGEVSWTRPHWIELSWLAFLVWSLIRLALSDPTFSDNYPLSIFLFFYFLPTAGLLAARHAPTSHQQLHAASWILIAYGVYLSILAILETKGPGGLVFPRYIVSETYPEFLGRARGPYLNPIANGIVLGTCLSAALVWWLKANTIGRVAIGGVALLNLLAIYLTYTRSCWLSAMAVVASTALLAAPWRLRWTMVTWGTLAAALAGGVLLDQASSFKRDKYVSEAEMAESASLRPMLATVAWKMFQDRPFFGCGFGQYKKFDAPYLVAPGNRQPLQKVAPYVQHNTLLATLVETGGIGLSLLVAFTIITLVTGLSLVAHPLAAPSDRAVAIITIGVTTSVSVNGMFHDVLIAEGVTMLWLVAAGLLANRFRAVQKGAESASQVENRLIPATPWRLGLEPRHLNPTHSNP